MIAKSEERSKEYKYQEEKMKNKNQYIEICDPIYRMRRYTDEGFIFLI